MSSSSHENAPEVLGICLFDSPISRPTDTVVIIDNNDNNGDCNSTSISSSDDDYKDTGTPLIDDHFKKCVHLLDVYHDSQETLLPSALPMMTMKNKLACPILDIRPSNSRLVHSITSITELTTGEVVRRVVEGSHWTMMFTGHVETVASLVKTFLLSN